MELILKYFPELTHSQKQQFQNMGPIYQDWNSKVNVISRKDFGFFYERHVLHSLGIAKIIQFKPQTSIMDVGTGGGFPGIPLAILFPEAKFHLIDSTGKKIIVVQDVIHQLELKNVTCEQARAENLKVQYDFIISRAVTALPSFIILTSGLISGNSKNHLKNGVLYLKGGDFEEELKSLRMKKKIFELSPYFEEDFFTTKKLIHIYK